MKRFLIFVLSLVSFISLVACGSSVSTSSNDTSASTNLSNDTTMDLTQIQDGNYSSLQGSWAEVVYAANYGYDKGFIWNAGSNGDTLSVSSNKIILNNSDVLIQGNKLTDNAGDHSLSFEKNEGSLDATLVDQTVAINWSVTFYPKGVKNDLHLNNGVKIDNTKNHIAIWTSNNGYTTIFEQTDLITNTTLSEGNNETEVDSSKSLIGNDIENTMQKIDSRVAKIKNSLNYEYYKDYYDKGILVFRYFKHDFDKELSAEYNLYYDEQGKLIYAEITHYRGVLYSIYFHNDELLHVEVGPFFEGGPYINGGMENVKAVIKKDSSYAFVLDDISLCLEHAYK